MLFLTLVFFVVVLLGLNYLYRSTQKLGQTVFVGLLLGLVGGALLQSLGCLLYTSIETKRAKYFLVCISI